MDTVRTRRQVGATIAGAGLAVAGVMASALATIPVVVFLALDADDLTLPIYALLFVVGYIGLTLVGVAYLTLTGRGWRFLDLKPLDRESLKAVVGFTVLAVSFVVVVGILTTVTSLETSENVNLAPGLAGNTDYLLLLVLVALLVNGPAEEFLFRNVIQKSLYRVFSRRAAIVVTSLIFALVHIPAFWTTNYGALATSLSVIFVGSLVFGTAYAKTESLTVVALVHGLFNAVQIFMLYLVLTFG
ncbi:CPBP family intramembrane glutamic endopeptidase [Haloarchaeobius sp. HME9146]|uniref:CPBP family intramembrane glutamic endopeptidase n=1 Tax=Haloarchaeobius sp. HME9146 TaxID=2978732 RepID=UPI0021BEA20D|nr:type II CAAX endopeptidase family protein [Haloarchaeobius sp. HME9146]MCT9095046.1 CPBP family intramembrane metalloprotease [Haloarchaeobius sp. HME9146]